MQEALYSRRKVRLALAVGAGLVVSAGLLFGLRAPRRPQARSTNVPVVAQVDDEPAPNGVWSRLRALALGAPASADVTERRAEALEARAALRAYDGAPPRIPHQVDQRNAPDCLYCHSEGLALAGRVAPKMSHEPYLNCLQCHVVERASPANDWVIPEAANAPAPQSRETSFEPAPTVKRAPPWAPDAPPPMPHSTHMRGDCASCHGPSARDGLRTSHIQRRNCQQCHAQSELDGSRRLEDPRSLADEWPSERQRKAPR